MKDVRLVGVLAEMIAYALTFLAVISAISLVHHW